MAEYSLKAVFGLDATGLKTGLKQVRGEVNDLVTKWSALRVAAAVGAFTLLAKQSVELGAKLADTAEQVGINVEALQTLNAVARDNGSSQDQMAKALVRTRTAVEEAANGNKTYQRAIQALGLDTAKLLALPVELRMKGIADGFAAAKDQGAAFNSLSLLFGEKVGPKMIGVLNSLSKQSFPELAASAKLAGDVMSAETIAALAKADDAIEAFKQRAVIAVGNIIVNFRSEEGIRLLGLQFLKVVGQFGAGIADAVMETGSLIKAVYSGGFTAVVNGFRDHLVSVAANFAKLWNELMPERFEINIANIEEWRSAGKSIAEEVREAIAATSPSTFKKEFGEFWDKRIDDQKQVVAEMNKVDFGEAADALRKAGDMTAVSVEKAADKVEEGGVKAGDAIAKGGDKAAVSIGEAVAAISGAVAGIRGGSVFNSASDAALQEIVRRNTSQSQALYGRGIMSGAFSAGSAADRAEAARLKLEADNAQKELQMRQGVRSAFAAGGEQGVFRAFSQTDPTILTRMIDQFARNLTEAEQQTQLLSTIERGLVARGIIGRL